ncbi:MAG: tetratricopeptide repeat protein [Desulfobacula sp.]|nr:tetratricopeptide repeat protein [Desulfobacula sp.]
MVKKTLLAKYNYPIIAFLLIMGVYLPVNYFEFVNMDDMELFERFFYNKEPIDFYTLFFRGSSTRYYRPLLTVFSYLDVQIWGASIAGYHFTNYVMHLVNVFFVYLIVLKIFKHDDSAIVYAAIAMILFGVHPLTCESVAWVSGRSDLFGSFFVLMAILIYFFKHRIRYILVPLAVFLGMLCKESALAGVPLLIMIDLVFNLFNKQSVKSIALNLCKWICLMAIPLGLYFFFRTNGLVHITYTHAAFGITNPVVANAPTNSYIFEVWISVLKIFPVIAFYLKKIIFPFPLNFAITSIHTIGYSIGFAAFCLVNLILLVKKQFILVICSMMLIMSFLPALPVALGKIAWVVLAERYLYLSVAFFAVFVPVYLHFLLLKNKISKKILSIILVLLISVFFVGTATRVWVWQNSKTLWADTLVKNPESSQVLVKFAQTMENEKSIWAYRKALSVSSYFKYKDIALMALATHEASLNNYEPTMEYIKKALQFNDNSENFFEAAQIVQGFETDDKKDKAKYNRQALSYYQTGYNKKKSDIVLYKIGNLYRQLNQIESAKAVYKKLIVQYPDSEYAKYAEVILAK